MTNDNLDPISPAEAKEMYLDARKREVSQSTLDGYHYRLKHFIRWCQDVEGLDNMNDLTGRKLQKFKTWRRDDGDLKPISLEGQLDALRLFIRWCGSIDAVDQDLHEKFEALMPSLDKTDEQSEAILEEDEAEALLGYQRKFEYASRAHVIIEVLWHTGMRLGALHALDVDDYDEEEERLEVRHRTQDNSHGILIESEDTPLKNGTEGERMIALNADVCRVIEDWRDHHRHDVTDSDGREPLLTTRNGRMPRSSIRDAVYRVSRPCYYSDDCPAGRDTEDCEATTYPHYCKCPVNVSPHAIRRGSITHFLTKDVPETVVSDRMNVGQDVLDKHYDKRDESVKVEQRRGYLDNI